MSSASRKVFVLGAGFTKAFFPGAPLMMDDYGLDSLLDKFQEFELARRILKLELERDQKKAGQVNMERLMTR